MSSNPPRPTWFQRLLIGLAALLFAIGSLGVFLPLLPTTPFMLAAVALASHGSPRFARWIRAHRFAGPAIRNWEHERAISRKAKTLALIMIASSAAMVIWQIDYRPLAIGVVIGLGVIATFLITRPSPRQSPRAQAETDRS